MTKDQAKQLREPFKAEQIGKLPKPTKKDNPKGKCSECGGWHGLPAVHLDYVGHAATTDRLIQVDPEWSWEPMALGPNGEPLMTNGGMWIKLTVAGVTRPGFGDGNSPKEIIGDAIRNAAMRFGVALDLWAKEDLHGSDEAASAPPKRPGVASSPGASSRKPASSNTSRAEPQAAKAVSQADNAATPDEPASAPDSFSFADRAAEALAKKSGKSTPAQQKKIGDLIVALAELREKGVLEVTESLEASEGMQLEALTGADADTLIGKLERWQKNLLKEKAAA